MELSRSPPRREISEDHQPRASGGTGLAVFQKVLSNTLPQHLERGVIVPIRTVGIGTTTSLKVSFWQSAVEEAPQASDADYVTVSLRTSVCRAWRNATPSGLMTMLLFEGAHWRFERPATFTQFHLPFAVLRTICDGMFGRELSHCDLKMLANIKDTRLLGALHSIQDRVCVIDPTNLLLDSWSLILSEALLRRLSSHGERQARTAFGKIPGRSIARVVDYIEASIDCDLRLPSLASVAAMSVYHFARSFKETVGMSPHAYVLSRRIDRARAMLSRKEGGLADVALACGFSSQAHFTTAFSRNLGMTPGQYRHTVSPGRGA